ncbi:Dynein alpha chain, flagellar outer arm [Gracilariopsis chorda]|uniref:Dynein alpha chain, flagellar outer arm n=1 Tax=Gracilariopsis chorda TaxID=448386 RepID=A0A2V3IUF9_9FLOR|nr:Dynein alpha chain, flagellar outer arm [Gracilariopsis chorda]|eukprot:PXF45752.1 Dynein alpha chain, flagellar outer arm [Gracilariopsis chorda]
MEWLGNFEARGPAPPPRKGHTMTRLLNTPLLVMFGGEDETGSLQNDMFVLHVERRQWHNVTYASGPKPSPRLLHTAVAISSHMLIIIGGETWETGGTEVSPTIAMNDIWVFDYYDSSWREIGRSDFERLPVLSCLSAVFGRAKGQVPGVYIFGGFGRSERNGSVVYKLRTSDWKLETIRVVNSKKRKDTHNSIGRSPNPEKITWHPRERESHGAIWLPGYGMLVVGGDGGSSILGDCWLFFQDEKDPQTWRWKEIHLKPVGGQTENRLPPLAGHSLVALPTSTVQVLVWGGILNSGQEVMDSEFSYVIDLDRLDRAHTRRVKNVGKTPATGRILHGFARANDLLFAVGGCDADGNVLPGTQYGRLLPKLKASVQAARFFGPKALRTAVGETDVKTDVNNAVQNTGTEDSAAKKVQAKANKDADGTNGRSRGPFPGKVLEVTDMGLLVSIVIDGKPFKGVLVKNPTNGKREKKEGAEDKMQIDGQKSKPLEAVPRKKPKLDPAAEALPDSPEIRPKPKPISREEVIQLE